MGESPSGLAVLPATSNVSEVSALFWPQLATGSASSWRLGERLAD